MPSWISGGNVAARNALAWCAAFDCILEQPLFVIKTLPRSCVERTHESVYGMSTDDKAATQHNGMNDLSITVHCRKYACLAHDVSCDPQHASPNSPSLPPPVVQYQSCAMLQWQTCVPYIPRVCLAVHNRHAWKCSISFAKAEVCKWKQNYEIENPCMLEGVGCQKLEKKKKIFYKLQALVSKQDWSCVPIMAIIFNSAHEWV